MCYFWPTCVLLSSQQTGSKVTMYNLCSKWNYTEVVYICKKYHLVLIDHTCELLTTAKIYLCLKHYLLNLRFSEKWYFRPCSPPTVYISQHRATCGSWSITTAVVKICHRHSPKFCLDENFLVNTMGWNERSDPDMRTANFEFSCDVYREGVL